MTTITRIVRVLCISGDETVFAAVHDIPATVEGLAAEIGEGWLEGISGDDWSAYLDEEGKIKGLPINERATRLARALGWDPSHVDLLVGPVVFLGPVDEEGDETDVTAQVIDRASLWGYLGDGKGE